MRRLRVIAIAVLIFTGLTIALAQAPAPSPSRSQEAGALAERLGREQSAEGLETILRARNEDLLAVYTRAFRDSAMREAGSRPGGIPLPAEIEALIVKYYDDPKTGAPLLRLIASGWSRYRTRALFDLMLAEWRTGRRRNGGPELRDAILRTDAPGVEAPLLEHLKAMPDPAGYDGNAIAAFLAARKYRPAVPVLAAIVRNGQTGAVRSASDALLRIGGPEATAAALARLAWLRDQPAAPAAAGEMASLAGQIAQLPPEEPVSYAALRKALPPDPDQSQKSLLIRFAAKRKDKAAAPDAIAWLGDSKLHRVSLDLLIDLDSPEIWKQARAEIERLKAAGALNDGQYQYASRTLDDKIADPEKHFAAKRQAARAQELAAMVRFINASRAQVRELRESDPDKYVAAVLEEIGARGRLAAEYADLPASRGLQAELATQYLQLGNFVRFRMKRAPQALELYTESARAGGPGELASADTYQFDLRDNARAIASYERQLEQYRRAPPPSSGNEMEAGLANWLKLWLEHQVQYLRTGRTYTGTIRIEDVAGAAPILYFGAGGGAEADDLDLRPLSRLLAAAQGGDRPARIDRAAVARELAKLPPSAFTLARTALYVGLLPDAAAIRNYLGKHDPAGYASACLFAIVRMADQPPGAGGEMAAMVPSLAVEPLGAANPMRIAAAGFLEERRIAVRVDIPQQPGMR